MLMPLSSKSVFIIAVHNPLWKIFPTFPYHAVFFYPIDVIRMYSNIYICVFSYLASASSTKL